MKSKKYRSTGNKAEEHNTWYIGYGDEHNQWIVESGLPYAKEAIKDYWTRCLSQNL